MFGWSNLHNESILDSSISNFNPSNELLLMVFMENKTFDILCLAIYTLPYTPSSNYLMNI